MHSMRRVVLVLAPAIAIGLCASVWVAVHTRNDIDHSDPDGGAYIGIADQIRDGHGPVAPSTYKFDSFEPRQAIAFDGRVPSTHFPPGYPAALAAGSLVTGETRSAARALTAGCVVANVVLLAALAARMTGYRSVFVATAPVLLVLFVPDRYPFDGPGWLQVNLGVYSEPLFLVITGAALLVTATALTEAPSRRRRLSTVGVGALTALAILVRYAGISLLLTVVVAFAVLGTMRTVRDRVFDTLLVGAIAILPVAVFLGWATGRGGGEARTFAYHPSHETGEIVRRVGHSFVPYNWPDPLPAIAVVVVVVVAIGGAWWLPKRAAQLWAGDERADVLMRITGLFVVFYLVVLVLTRTFVDVTTRYGARFLTPVRGLTYVLVVVVLYRLAAAYVKVPIVVAVLGVLVAALVWADWRLERYWFDRATAPVREPTATEIALAGVPQDAIVVTDVPFIAYLRAGRSSFILPSKTIFLTGEPNRDFERQLDLWADVLRERGGYAFFRSFFDIAAPSDLARHVDMQLIAVSPSAGERLYRIRPSPG